jgi:hypothetical protein
MTDALQGVQATRSIAGGGRATITVHSHGPAATGHGGDVDLAARLVLDVPLNLS